MVGVVEETCVVTMRCAGCELCGRVVWWVGIVVGLIGVNCGVLCGRWCGGELCGVWVLWRSVLC